MAIEVFEHPLKVGSIMVMQQVHTISGFIKEIDRLYRNPKALNSVKNGAWESLSTQEFLEQVKLLALGLVKLGVKKGDRVGIIALPSSNWTIADMAIMAAGGVTVALFANISSENFLFEITQAEVKIAFVAGQEQWERFKQYKNLLRIGISLENEPQPDTLKFNDIIELGRQMLNEQPDAYERLLDSIQPSDMATIIYTSGSTGVPKGAVHTHESLFSLLHTDIFNWDENKDVYLSVLPLAHVFARTFNFVMMGGGISCYYYNDLKNIGGVCQEIHPTIMIVVPRLLEKVYAKMVAKVELAGHMKRAIGNWAFDMANKEEKTIWKNLFHPLAEVLVYSALRKALGGKLRVLVSGGAPLNPHLYHFFVDIGVPVYEGWGLTEACPVTVNPLKIKIGSIGKPIGNLQVKTSPEGELLVKGSLVMKEYYKNPELTAQTIDSEGWLHTGDKGVIDEEGYVKIIGRIKDLVKTSTGEIIAPIPIEQELCKAPFIDMAMVIAEQRKFVSCLLVPDFEVLKVLKASKGQEYISDHEFLEGDFIKSEMERLISRVNEHLNYWEKIRDYRFIDHNLSIETGELTPSMKLIRDVVEKKYQHLINAIYQEEKSDERAYSDS